MPHFRTWDNTFYDFYAVGSLLQGTRSVPAEELTLNYERIRVGF